MLDIPVSIGLVSLGLVLTPFLWRRRVIRQRVAKRERMTRCH